MAVPTSNEVDTKTSCHSDDYTDERHPLGFQNEGDQDEHD